MRSFQLWQETTRILTNIHDFRSSKAEPNRYPPSHSMHDWFTAAADHMDTFSHRKTSTLVHALAQAGARMDASSRAANMNQARPTGNHESDPTGISPDQHPEKNSGSSKRNPALRKGIKELQDAASAFDFAVSKAFQRRRTTTQAQEQDILFKLQQVADDIARISGQNPARSTSTCDHHQPASQATTAPATASVPASSTPHGPPTLGQINRRRRGQGGDSAPKVLSIFFANITSMSKKAEQFLTNRQEAFGSRQKRTFATAS